MAAGTVSGKRGEVGAMSAGWRRDFSVAAQAIVAGGAGMFQAQSGSKFIDRAAHKLNSVHRFRISHGLDRIVTSRDHG